MNELVELYNGKEPRVSTFLLFKAFGYNEHRFLKEVILKNKHLFESKGELISTSTNVEKKRGRPDESFLLNERQFILLVLLVKNTPESITLKDRVESEFFNLRTKLAALISTQSSDQWQTARQDGKLIYHQKTDVIRRFVDYAVAQGSQNAEKYYIHFAKAENSALFFLEQKFKNVREMLSIRQLMMVAVADQIIEKAIQEGMDQGMPYKEIYVYAKDRIVAFSNIVGKSHVMEALPNLNGVPKSLGN